MRQARTPAAPSGGEAELAAVRRVKSALTGPDAPMGARVSGLAQVLLQLRRGGQGKRPRRANGAD